LIETSGEVPQVPNYFAVASEFMRSLSCVGALLVTPCLLFSQNVPAISIPAGELSAEEIFARFAREILFLTCNVSADEAKQASGVLVSQDGFVVTNAHVVEGCRSITVTYMNGAVRRSYSPVLKYYDKLTDTAVLKLPEQGVEYLPIPARTARIGERVYSIGNPRGLEQSISEGIVSGYRQEGGASWIQHSAPISAGSSGGALLSSRGELLGINAFLITESQNLNFAVPAETLTRSLSAARARADNLEYPPTPHILPSPQVLFTNAANDQTGGRLDLAISEYQEFLRSYPDNPNVARAQYNIGENHYTQQRYDQAAHDFQKVIDSYPEDPTLTPQAYFMAGMALKSINADAAVASWHRLIAKYPKTDAAAQARIQLRALRRR
jgi:S1-C subfamily serine protease